MKRIKFFLSHLKNFLHSRSEKGFTLAEIMVTAGIVAVLAVAIMRMNSMAQKTAKTTAQQLEATQVLSRVQQILQDPISCQKTFENATPQPTATITVIKRKVSGSATPENAVGAGATCVSGTLKPGGTSICTSGSGSSGRVALFKMVLKQTNSPLVLDGAATGELELHMVKGAGATINWEAAPSSQASKIDIHNLSSYGGITTIKRIPVSLFMKASKVVDCYTNELNFIEQACLSLGGNYDQNVTPNCVINRTTCRDVVIAAVGSVNYNSLNMGTGASGSCNADEVLMGLKAVNSVGESAVIDGGTPIDFSRLQLTLTCCKK